MVLLTVVSPLDDPLADAVDVVRGRGLTDQADALGEARRADHARGRRPDGLGRVRVPPPSDQTRTVVELRVHGNQSMTSDEVLALAGVAVGDRLAEGHAEIIAERLRDSGQFDALEVRTRSRSLTATSEVVLVVVVPWCASARSKQMAASRCLFVRRRRDRSVTGSRVSLAHRSSSALRL